MNALSNPRLRLFVGATMISFSPVWVKLVGVSPTTSGFYRVCIGGAVFEWNDEWWKVKTEDGGSPDAHDNSGFETTWNPGAHPDGFAYTYTHGNVDFHANPHAYADAHTDPHTAAGRAVV